MRHSILVLSLLLGAAAAVPATAQDGRDTDRTALDEFYDPFDLYGRAEGSAPVKTWTYEVREGDTLFTIAEKYLGDAYKAETLAEINKIADPLRLKEGQRIKIPQGRLGLLYSLQKLEEGCNVMEVNEDHRFKAGDRFQFRVASNIDGYLYIFNQSASGDLEQLFPDAGKKSFRVRQFSEYLLPREGWFRFDKARGPEQLLVLVSAQPLSGLDRDLAAESALRNKFKSYFSGSSAKGIAVDSGQQGRSRSVVMTSPVDNTLVIAHRVLLRKGN